VAALLQPAQQRQLAQGHGWGSAAGAACGERP
jgi:hypothetical protein